MAECVLRVMKCVWCALDCFDMGGNAGVFLCSRVLFEIGLACLAVSGLT
jgi:hypothetical protein